MQPFPLKLAATAPGNRVKLKIEMHLPTINSHGQAVSLRQGKQKTWIFSFQSWSLLGALFQHQVTSRHDL